MNGNSLKNLVIDDNSGMAEDESSPRSTKKARQSLDFDEFIGAPEEMLRRIEAAQKEGIWKSLQHVKVELSRSESKNERLARELQVSKEGIFRVKNFLLKLLKGFINEENFEGVMGDLEITEIYLKLKDTLSSSTGMENLQRILEKFDEVSVLEGKIAWLEEERTRQQELLSEIEQRATEFERKNRRLELEQAKIFSAEKGSRPADLNVTPAIPDTTGTSQEQHVVMAELESLRKIANQRLLELERIEHERSNLKSQNLQLNEKIRRLPEEAIKDPRSYKDIKRENQFLLEDLSKFKKSFHNIEQLLIDSDKQKQGLLLEIERGKAEQRLELRRFLDELESELSRLRRERDNMRELYEQANMQVSSANKLNSTLQATISKLETRSRIFEKIENRQQAFITALNSISKDEDEIKKLQDMITKLKDDEMTIINELEELGKAFEDMKNQNALLMKMITEKDEANSKLLGEKLRLEFNLVQIKKDAEISTQKAAAIERASISRLEAADIQEQDLRKQLSAFEGTINQKLLEIEKQQIRISELIHERDVLNAKLNKYSEADLERVIAERDKSYSQLQFEKQRISEDLDTAQRKLKSYQDSGKGFQKDLEEELSLYKKLMKCNSCHIRDKNAVITKCMHVFCKQCLDTRIETRQRKCPNCGEMFGAGDIRLIYL